MGRTGIRPSTAFDERRDGMGSQCQIAMTGTGLRSGRHFCAIACKRKRKYKSKCNSEYNSKYKSECNSNNNSKDNNKCKCKNNSKCKSSRGSFDCAGLFDGFDNS